MKEYYYCILTLTPVFLYLSGYSGFLTVYLSGLKVVTGILRYPTAGWTDRLHYGSSRRQRRSSFIASSRATSEHNFSGVECLCQPFGRVAADAAQSGDREECLVGKPASTALTGKVSADHFGLPAKLYSGPSASFLNPADSPAAHGRRTIVSGNITGKPRLCFFST